LDFSPEYKTVGLKSSSLCNRKIRPINGTVKDKKTVFTQSVKHGLIIKYGYPQHFDFNIASLVFITFAHFKKSEDLC